MTHRPARAGEALAVGFEGTRLPDRVEALADRAGLGAVVLFQRNCPTLEAVLDPKADPQRAGYNKEQAEIAIGAGGLTGRGYLKGTQTNLDFVPAQHTDFIFTVVGEETGFAGSLLLIGLFSFLIWRALRIAMMSKDPFGARLAAGVGA